MNQTLVEKILSAKCGGKVTPGEIVIVPLDLVMAQDGTAPLAIESWKKLGLNKVAKPKNTIFFLDHSAPASRKELAASHKVMREFAEKHGTIITQVGDGICHQLLPEYYVKPGDIVIGADSHTCTHGALGAFATGMGSTDIAVGMALGKMWFKVPATIKVEVKGKFPKGVVAKDLILDIIGTLTSEGAVYKALEFSGETVSALPMSERLTICNMAVEAGAKVGVIASDNITKKYLKDLNRGKDYIQVEADADAEYEKVISIDADELSPKVALPHGVDNGNGQDQAERQGQPRPAPWNQGEIRTETEKEEKDPRKGPSSHFAGVMSPPQNRENKDNEPEKAAIRTELSFDRCHHLGSLHANGPIGEAETP